MRRSPAPDPRRPVAILIAAAVLLVTVAGCGQPTRATVTGRVTSGGQPVGDAFVLFSPAAGPAAGAVTDAAGSYRLVTGGPHGDRVFIGRCQITVTDANPEGRSGGVRILPRLADPATSGLMAELTAGANVVDLALPER